MSLPRVVVLFLRIPELLRVMFGNVFQPRVAIFVLDFFAVDGADSALKPRERESHNLFGVERVPELGTWSVRVTLDVRLAKQSKNRVHNSSIGLYSR